MEIPDIGTRFSKQNISFVPRQSIPNSLSDNPHQRTSYLYHFAKRSRLNKKKPSPNIHFGSSSLVETFASRPKHQDSALAEKPLLNDTVKIDTVENQIEDKQKDSNPDLAKKAKKLTVRKVIDMATIASYALFIGSAIYFNHAHSPLEKLSSKLSKNAIKTKSLKESLEHQAEIITGKSGKGNWVYRLFSYFGKNKENSAELTNNLIYGFGTLVVMPLVILYSPFGKKSATKEDRTFTLLRQPISFATVFALQYTFDEITKYLIPKMNSYGLLDTVTKKSTNGKQVNILYSRDKALDKIKEFFSARINHNEERCFHFDDAEFNRLSNKKPLHHGRIKSLLGFNQDMKLLNEFKLRKFITIIEEYAGKPGKEGDLKNVLELKALLNNYIKDAPELVDHLENLVFSATRSKAMKELLTVGANSIFSQALGIMMLNFVYGKMMKSYVKWKKDHAVLPPQSTSPPTADSFKAEKGGQK